ncbi:MAG: glycosyltransferase family 39 protein [Acidobacteriia bacterium]|nr:glycosyltransferase family 39 protein [Terriglobia bacterium]
MDASQAKAGNRNLSYANRVWRAVLDALSGAPQQAMGRKDLPGLLLILASFAAGLASTWQRWGNPLVDSGRELNAPLRLLRGEMLYSDVRYHYGPLSPYVDAALYRIFEPSLWVLWGRGIVSTLIILGLVYWLGRQVTGRFPATLTCLAVTWVCALKSQGNYIMPYAYAGLDGNIFALATTALLIIFLRQERLRWLFAAGVLAALAVVTKTEMGITAVGTGFVATALAGYPRVRRIAAWLVVFLLPALGIPAVVYTWLAARVGWHTLANESYLFFSHVPWQIMYFNKWRFGLDRPWHSLGLMAATLARLIAFAGLLASAALLLEKRRKDAQGASAPTSGGPGGAWKLLAVSLAGIVVTSIGLSDLGPFMAMPFILLAFIAAGLAAFVQSSCEGALEARSNAGTLVILAVFSFGSLARIVLRVSTGGALSSFLLPGAVLFFVYAWLVIFPLFLPEPESRRLAGKLASSVLVAALLVTAGTLCVRYRRKFTYPIVTPRGTWRTYPELGLAMDQALQFIEKNTARGDAVAILPEGSALNFLTDRRNPLREEIIVPGYVDAAGEERAIERLRSQRVPLVLIANRPTREYAQTIFGVDYNQRLFSWIEQNYRLCGVFGPRPDPSLSIGSPVFFIRSYCRIPSPPR